MSDQDKTQEEKTETPKLQVSLLSDEEREQADVFMRALEQDEELQNRFGMAIIGNTTIMNLLVGQVIRCLQGVSDMINNAAGRAAYQIRVTRDLPEVEGSYYLLNIAEDGVGESKVRIEAQMDEAEGQWEDITDQMDNPELFAAIDKEIAEMDPAPQMGETLYMLIMEVHPEMVVDGKTVNGEDVSPGANKPDASNDE